MRVPMGLSGFILDSRRGLHPAHPDAWDAKLLLNHVWHLQACGVARSGLKLKHWARSGLSTRIAPLGPVFQLQGRL